MTLADGLIFKTIISNKKKLDLDFDEPPSFDWRKEGAVTPARNQFKDQLCGSCYAFVVVAVLESHYFIKTGKLLQLSEQEIVDCSHNAGCFGGSQEENYNYLIENGISLAEDYPYESKFGECRREKAQRSEIKVFGYKEIDEKDYKKVLARYGPITVSIYSMAKTFRFYKEGILQDPTITSENTDHVVLLVGYGTDNETGIDYWIMKNSFSEDWGEKGFLRLAITNNTISSIGYIPLLDPSDADGNEVEYFYYIGTIVDYFFYFFIFCILVALLMILFVYLWRLHRKKTFGIIKV